jgi:hypothetical protein
VLRVDFFTVADREHDVGGVTAPSASPIFGEHRAQLRDGRTTLLHQASGPTPIIVDEGERPAEHHPAGSETRSQTSEDVLANTGPL